MKFITIKENLKQGLAIVSHLTSKNINLPILNNILIKAKKEGIELTSTNLEISIEHFLRGKIEKEGEFTVDSRLINEYISLLPDEKVEIETINDDLKIKGVNYKTKIKGQTANDFPVLPKNENKDSYNLNINEFKNALSNVIFSVANNDNRVELSGVFFSFKNNNLTLVGTDSYRLSEKTIKYNNNSNEKSIIVPAKTIQELIRILGNLKTEEQLENNEEIKIYINENQIFFSFGSTKLTSRIIIGNYPDYKQIIPQNEKTIITISKEALIKAVKTAGLFSKTGINDIGLTFKKNKTIIFSSSSQTGENFIDLDSEIKGEDNEIFVNYKYLLEGLNSINSNNIIIKIIDNNTPCLLQSEENDNFLYLVMPIRQ
ncbi:MAG TPA: DNA polymerase III subunit beta [bacterium]|nr:DNA polymerase III subunit beta [bacterium]